MFKSPQPSLRRFRPSWQPLVDGRVLRGEKVEFEYWSHVEATSSHHDHRSRSLTFAGLWSSCGGSFSLGWSATALLGTVFCLLDFFLWRRLLDRLFLLSRSFLRLLGFWCGGSLHLKKPKNFVLFYCEIGAKKTLCSRKVISPIGALKLRNNLMSDRMDSPLLDGHGPS